MKKMTLSVTCDGATGTCHNEATRQDVPLGWNGKSVTVDLCDLHFGLVEDTVWALITAGVPAEKKKRKSPTKKTVSSKSVQTSTASEAAADVTPAKLDAPTFAAAAVDKSAECNYCGEIKKSNAGLAQHLKYKHKQTLAKNASYRGAKKKGS